jgi:hypothetical protein
MGARPVDLEIVSGGPVVATSYWTFAAAAGAGYLLGGGRLPRRIVTLALTEGGRMALLVVLRELASRETGITPAARPQHGSANARPAETT